MFNYLPFFKENTNNLKINKIKSIVEQMKERIAFYYAVQITIKAKLQNAAWLLLFREPGPKGGICVCDLPISCGLQHR